MCGADRGSEEVLERKGTLFLPFTFTLLEGLLVCCSLDVGLVIALWSSLILASHLSSSISHIHFMESEGRSTCSLIK